MKVVNHGLCKVNCDLHYDNLREKQRGIESKECHQNIYMIFNHDRKTEKKLKIKIKRQISWIIQSSDRVPWFVKDSGGDGASKARGHFEMKNKY